MIGDNSLRDWLGEFVAVLYVHHHPAWLIRRSTHLVVVDIKGRILVKSARVGLGLLDDLHDASDAWDSTLLAATSIEEGLVAKLHVLHVLACGRIADA